MQTTPVTCVCVCVSSSPSLPSLSFALCSSLFLAAARQIRYILLSLSFPFCVLFLKNRCLLLGCGVSKNLPLMVESTNSGAFIAFARLLLPLLLSRFTCCQLICINYFLTSKRERGCGQRGGGRWVAYIRCPCRENKKTVGQTRNKNREWQWQLIDKQLNWTVNSNNNNNNNNIRTGEMKTTTAVIESILYMLRQATILDCELPSILIYCSLYCYINTIRVKNKSK